MSKSMILIFYIYILNKVIGVRRKAVTAHHQKTSHLYSGVIFEPHWWPWPLTFWLKKGTYHIVQSWVVFVPHIKQIGRIGMELQSGHVQNFKWPLLLWPLTFWPRNGARHILPHGCISATYEVNPPNTVWAIKRTHPKFQTTRVTLTFDLLTQKWRATHHPPMGLFVPHMKRIGEIGSELQSGHDKNLRKRPKLTQQGHRWAMKSCDCPPLANVTVTLMGHICATLVTLTFDLLTRKWCVTHRPVMRYVFVPPMMGISRTGTKLRSGHDQNFERPVWPWPLTFWTGNGARHIVSPWVVFVPHMKQICQIGSELQSGHDQNFERPVWPWPLTFWLENGARHIVSPWVVFVPHMNQIGQIGSELRSGHGKNGKKNGRKRHKYGRQGRGVEFFGPNF